MAATQRNLPFHAGQYVSQSQFADSTPLDKTRAPTIRALWDAVLQSLDHVIGSSTLYPDGLKQQIGLQDLNDKLQQWRHAIDPLEKAESLLVSDKELDTVRTLLLQLGAYLLRLLLPCSIGTTACKSDISSTLFNDRITPQFVHSQPESSKRQVVSQGEHNEEIIQSTSNLQRLVHRTKTFLIASIGRGENSAKNHTAAAQYESMVAISLQRTAHSLEASITGLHQMGNLLLQLLSTLNKADVPLELQSIFTRNEGFTQPGELSAAAYQRQIRDKFPEASTQLVERLGNVNWHRHCRLRGIDQRLDYLDRGLVAVGKAISFRDSALGSSMLQPVSNALSDCSIASNPTSTASGSLQRIPPFPKQAASGGMFTCPYCQKHVNDIHDSSSWRRHFLEDLEPYVCTFEACPTPDRSYGTRNNWANHEIGFHRSDPIYSCDECEDVTFETENEFYQHFTVHHPSMTAIQRRMIVRMRILRRKQGIDTQKCPFCLACGFSSYRNLISHMGKHLEDVALAAVPQVDHSHDEDGEVQSNTGSISSNASQHNLDKTVENNLRCICTGITGNDEAADATVQCVKCGTLQHVACYYVGMVTDIHHCVDCQEDLVDFAQNRWTSVLDDNQFVPGNFLVVDNVPCKSVVSTLRDLLFEMEGYQTFKAYYLANSIVCHVEFTEITTTTRGLIALYGRQLREELDATLHMRFCLSTDLQLVKDAYEMDSTNRESQNEGVALMTHIASSDRLSVPPNVANQGEGWQLPHHYQSDFSVLPVNNLAAVNYSGVFNQNDPSMFPQNEYSQFANSGLEVGLDFAASNTITDFPNFEEVHTNQKSSKRRRLNNVESEYECNICPRKYPRQCDLNRHVKTHTKSHKCPYDQCDDSFASTTQLKRHIITHESLDGVRRVYQCPKCPYNSGRRDVLKNHLSGLGHTQKYGVLNMPLEINLVSTGQDRALEEEIIQQV